MPLQIMHDQEKYISVPRVLVVSYVLIVWIILLYLGVSMGFKDSGVVSIMVIATVTMMLPLASSYWIARKSENKKMGIAKGLILGVLIALIFVPIGVSYTRSLFEYVVSLAIGASSIIFFFALGAILWCVTKFFPTKFQRGPLRF